VINSPSNNQVVNTDTITVTGYALGADMAIITKVMVKKYNLLYSVEIQK